MHKVVPIVLILLTAALSGCTGSNSTDESAQGDTQAFENANPNLDGTIVSVKLVPDNIRAGEKVTAKLAVANTGTETINTETIEIKAKVKTLDDFLANIALKFVSEDSKTRIYTMNFDEEIKPGTVKPLIAVFQTKQELEGRNLAGTYEITVTMSANGQKVDSKVIPVTLHSGTPREMQNTTQATATPTITATEEPTTTSTPEVTETPTPTPTPTPEPITVDKPTGNFTYARIKGWVFTVSTIDIDAGDAILWHNMDDEPRFTLAEMDGKMPNITVSYKTTVIFNTTGTYRFGLYYPHMRTGPSIQTIIVKLNTSSNTSSDTSNNTSSTY